MQANFKSPEGYSINDGIPTGLCSLRYASVSDAVNIIKTLGQDTQLGKIDLKQPTESSQSTLLITLY